MGRSKGFFEQLQTLNKIAPTAGDFKMGKVGFEPTRDFSHRFLRPKRIPFRHLPPFLRSYYKITIFSRP